MTAYFFAVFLAAASTGSVEKYLPQHQFYCPFENRDVIEKIVDAEPGKSFYEQIGKAIYKGVCMTSKGYEVGIVDVRNLASPAGTPYVCFHPLDLSDKSGTGEYCSTTAAIRDINVEKATRTGAFTLVTESPEAARAVCSEGGMVILGRNGDGWDRLSLVFPVELVPMVQFVTGDREQVLKDGCQGADYQAR